jgi:hypothetical protein
MARVPVHGIACAPSADDVSQIAPACGNMERRLESRCDST